MAAVDCHTPWTNIQIQKEMNDIDSSNFQYSRNDTIKEVHKRRTNIANSNTAYERAPVFLVSLEDCTLEKGGEKKLEVVVDGNPVPSIIWYKDGLRIKDCDVEHLGNSYSVYIVEAESADAGVYSVEANNDLGETKCYARVFFDEKGINLVDPAAPRFIKHFSDIKGCVGANCIFEAIVVGNPKPNVHWSFNNNPIHNSRYHYSNADSNYSLVVSNICFEDEGRFALIAENKHGKVSCSSFLFVSDNLFNDGYETSNGFITDSTRRSESVAARNNRYSKSCYHSDHSSHRGVSSQVGDDFDERFSHGERVSHRPLGFVIRPSFKSEGNKIQNKSNLKLFSEDDYFESDNTTEEVKRIHEVTRDTTEKRYRERVEVTDDEYEDKRSLRYKPVEFIVGKHGRRHMRNERSGEYRGTCSTERLDTDHKHRSLRQRKKRQIRLGSVPIREHSIRDISPLKTTYKPIDLIVGKSKVQKLIVETQEESDSKMYAKMNEDQYLDVTIPKSRHSSTVVKERQCEAGVSQFRFDGQHEKKILQPIEIPSELEFKIPKSNHSSTVYKNARQLDQIHTITQPSVILGQESVKVHQKPLRIDEEISLKIGKSGGEHISTIVCEKAPYDQTFNLETGRIVGHHDLRIIEEGVVDYANTNIQIPKPQTILGDHSSTVLREKLDNQKQIVNINVPTTIPGEAFERFYQNTVNAEECVQVRLPKSESHHTSTVIHQQAKEREAYDLNAIINIPGEHEKKSLILEPNVAEVCLPKRGKHSATLLCEKSEKINLGQLQAREGQHSYKFIEDSKADYSSTVMLNKNAERKKYDISLASEVSEFEDDTLTGVEHNQGHVVSWLSDIEKRHLASTESRRHLTTVVKEQDDKEMIEMLIPEQKDKCEVIAKLGDYSNAQSIVLQGPETIIDREVFHSDVKSEVVADIATRYAVSGELFNQEQSSLIMDSVKRREEIIGLQMSSSSAEIVAELKSQLELKGDHPHLCENASSFSMEIGDQFTYPSVEVRMPMPTVQPSRSVMLADVEPALEGPHDAFIAQTFSTSEVTIAPGHKRSVELNLSRPEMEASSSTVLADVRARLEAQGQIASFISMQPSSSSINMDLGQSVYKNVEVNIPGIEIEQSSSKVIAQLGGKLGTNEQAKSTSEPSSTYSICMTNIGKEQYDAMNVHMYNIKVDDSKAEVLVDLPGETQTQFIGDLDQSSSTITLETHKPMEITMLAPEQKSSSSTLMTRRKHYGLSTAEIKNFGDQRNTNDEIEVVLHEPYHKSKYNKFEDNRFLRTSTGSSTVIKEIGFDDDSTDRYYLSDGDISSSTMQVDIGKQYQNVPYYAVPVFLTKLNNCTIHEGERLILECKVTGADHIIWTKDNEYVDDHCQLDFINSFLARLTISEIFEDDGGLYTCIASCGNTSSQMAAFVTVEGVRYDISNNKQELKKVIGTLTFAEPIEKTNVYKHVASTKIAKSEVSRNGEQITLESTEVRVDPFEMFGARRGSRGSVSKIQVTDTVQILNCLPKVVSKADGSFLRLEVTTSGNVSKVDWMHNDILLQNNDVCRISTKQNVYSLIKSNLGTHDAGKYTVCVYDKSFSRQTSSCIVNVNAAPQRFKSKENKSLAEIKNANKMKNNIKKESILTSRVEDTTSSNKVVEKELEIITRKSPKPETKITVREASADNSVFVFSEMEDGEFIEQ